MSFWSLIKNSIQKIVTSFDLKFLDDLIYKGVYYFSKKCNQKIIELMESSFIDINNSNLIIFHTEMRDFLVSKKNTDNNITFEKSLLFLAKEDKIGEAMALFEEKKSLKYLYYHDTLRKSLQSYSKNFNNFESFYEISDFLIPASLSLVLSINEFSAESHFIFNRRSRDR